MRSRIQTFVAVVVIAIGLLIAAILGLFAYMSVTATPLHPDPARVSAVTRSTPPSKWSHAVDRGRQVVRAALVEQNLPGLSVAVGVDGEIVWAEGFGWANIDDQAPVTPDTRFRIGGPSLALTSAAVGLLLEKDKLKLDEQIQTYVPAFPQKQWPVTLRQLMGHLGGIRPGEGDGENLSEHCEQTIDGLQRFAKTPLVFEPGTHYYYSTYGWILVSAAVEAAAHERFFTFMRTQIFEPLGMAQTTADSAALPISDQAAFYYPRFAADTR
jgi:serine beta-lactamase-like protein LACTB, mitochondrial